MYVKMKVGGITMDPFSNMPIVILKDLNDKYAIPIWIGVYEASAIAAKLEDMELERPLTHDLLTNILTTLNAEVSRIEVYDIKDNTYYANIFFLSNGDEIVIDSRPSDAIALALRTDASIFVHKKVIDMSRTIDIGEDDKNKTKDEKWAEILEGLNPEDFGKYKM